MHGYTHNRALTWSLPWLTVLDSESPLLDCDVELDHSEFYHPLKNLDRARLPKLAHPEVLRGLEEEECRQLASLREQLGLYYFKTRPSHLPDWFDDLTIIQCVVPRDSPSVLL